LDVVDWIHVPEDMNWWLAFGSTVINVQDFLNYQSKFSASEGKSSVEYVRMILNIDIHQYTYVH
jgi:hypothetical protein